ncbi:aminotransferase class I/II-fold pyridoxal phosphate-dependent enzyme [Nocardia uniformis]|uniref:Aminotransferase class I/II-fold pyridoxal phosphate-dependent enzyme n=1 Tax=Nocardia uniformis TaxID=53432 RepID=A0A849C6D9_9NOCA|nr:aminotransferase class I/II-fold pyridoxal phosphate-dependent enzyme [Nocardia uniformis]NNH71980.1 aminotransferase class I/II-fold pyridoxal phosphate-dependent enzyme [Nocardia uniformis]
MTGDLVDLVGLRARTNRSEERKRQVRRYLDAASCFPGTDGRTYSGIIDAYHGETGLAPAPNAVVALDRAWDELLHLQRPDEYRDGRLYDKRQPLILRELAADKLFERLSRPVDGVVGVRVRPEEVVVCPYSSTVLLEEAVATLARPGGVIVCPEGFYKSSSIHVEKFGLSIVTCPGTQDDSFRIDPVALARCLDEVRDRLCGVLLTLPGNPVVASYSVAQLVEIGRVLVEHNVPVICDMAFDRLVADHIPIAALSVPTAAGPRRLYDRVLTITGNSKGYNAFGPCKLGAACSGNAEWLGELRERLTIAFQRETTHLVRAVLEHTTDEYFAANRTRMRTQFDRALRCVADLNARLGMDVLRPLGSPDGMFLTVVFDRDVLDLAGVHTSAQLEDLLLAAAGIDSVALDRTGSPRLGVRLNVLAPRTAPGHESADLLDELFDRIERLVRDIDTGHTYRTVLADRGLPALPEFAVAS